MARLKNSQWDIPDDQSGYVWGGAQLAVLMDIRDELQTLNRLLGCQRFLDIPYLLRDIKRNTTKPKRSKR